MQKKLADATKIDPGVVLSRTRGGAASRGAAAASAAEALDPLLAETAARRERGLDKKRVRLTVERSKRQKHVFNTDWGKGVHEVEESCRGELSLVSRDEEEEAEIALFYKVCGAAWCGPRRVPFFFSSYGTGQLRLVACCPLATPDS